MADLNSNKNMEGFEEICSGYKVFLDEGKTERECAEFIVAEAEAAGYRDLAKIVAEGGSLAAGDKVYALNMNKSVLLFNIGSDIVGRGMNIVGSHIDSPRLDIKQNPFVEKEELAYLDTHYYGGIKKYQWVTMPLAIHGVICRTDGSTVKVSVGEDAADPVFFVSDLLIHLSAEQLQKPAAKVIEGENLDIIVGSRPLEGEERNAVMAGVLDILEKKYGVCKDDFWSGELEVVPAGKARDAGFDRSMVLAYGQDDRSCSYASLRAILSVENPETSCCAIFADKEEIGSVGATGMQSHFFEDSVRELLECMGLGGELNATRVFRRSRMLSADVNAAFDPLYASAFEKSNASKLGKGLTFCKFKGARGKSGSNDANAEYLADLRSIMDRNEVLHQHTEGGKVDQGGGGTIAYILANYGMQVVDCCIPILNMHAPWEAISKDDLYEAYKGYTAFYAEA